MQSQAQFGIGDETAHPDAGAVEVEFAVEPLFGLAVPLRSSGNLVLAVVIAYVGYDMLLGFAQPEGGAEDHVLVDHALRETQPVPLEEVASVEARPGCGEAIGVRGDMIEAQGAVGFETSVAVLDDVVAADGSDEMFHAVPIDVVVCVHKEDVLARSLTEAEIAGCALTLVRLAKDLEAPVGLRESACDGGAAVGGTVVDEDDLQRLVGLPHD